MRENIGNFKKVAAFIEFFFVCYSILDTNINH